MEGPPVRKLLRPAVLAVGLIAVVALLQGLSRATVAHEASFSYGSHARQALDAYWNDPDSGTQPGIVIVHGGYWNSGSKADWKATAEWYATHGYAVFSVDHRFGTEAPWPGPRDDMLAAIEWIKTRSADFKLDPDRIAVIGSQAGGQLAALAGTYGSGNARVRGVVGLSAIASPKRAYDEAQTTAATASRRKIRDHTVITADCSPADGNATCLAHYDDMTVGKQASPDDAPMLLIHSSGDTVPGTHAGDVKTALAAQGVSDVTVKTVSGSSSGGPLLNDTALRDQTLTWITAHTAPRTVTPAQTAETPEPLAPRVAPSTSDDNGPSAQTSTAQTSTAQTGTAQTGTAQPLATTAATRYEQNYAYGTNARHQLTAYYYKKTTKQPALVLIHGGYWYEGDKSSWATDARWFADQGYAVFAINYRYNTTAGWTAQRTDVLAALAWIRGKATTFTIDPNRVVALGSSAGGHLATIAGTYGSGKSAFKAVAALSPVASPYRAYSDGQKSTSTTQQRKLRDTAILLGRCTPYSSDTTCWNRWIDMVAYQRASATDAPMYLVHSQNDFVPPAHSTDLCNKLKAKGVSCTAVTVSGSNKHGTALLSFTTVRTNVLKWLQAHD
jgi:acetyl esterase/lipase